MAGMTEWCSYQNPSARKCKPRLNFVKVCNHTGLQSNSNSKLCLLCIKRIAQNELNSVSLVLPEES